mmetsp:Transcript_36533/g.59073  ORF Transcript_36533/g.59073 Transcript_36533/m.59073 type:complete len:259 (-) Transcript_36533:132-908(-)|eukprot:CAMPEP_0184675798 /NCGR_PEP_ID=MMETSP0308-20130426/87997_1 /TAXON_ID=38269 /ORGANISM="Gloeochaete witrockiana, Strain SAG 46.84" /LENGTH=258 /DNA_ID=CAMNT_0027123559 /DNA_START=51 /DNA_END=827 /DNA_ORIENTATION=-
MAEVTVSEAAEDNVENRLFAHGCPEKLIFCLDVSAEMETLGGGSSNKRSRMDQVRRALCVFVNMKAKMNPRHQYALVLARERAEWHCDFTDDPDRFCERLFDIKTGDLYHSFDISSIFRVVTNKVEVPFPSTTTQNQALPKYVVRVIFIYGRSTIKPIRSEEEFENTFLVSRYFFFDALYVHDRPSDRNCPQDVYDVITSVENPDVMSYFFENSTNNKRLFQHISFLLAHPLQRPDQNDLQKYSDTAQLAPMPAPETD